MSIISSYVKKIYFYEQFAHIHKLISIQQIRQQLSIIKLNLSDRMKCIGFNGNQTWAQKSTQLLSCQQKQNFVGVSEIFDQTPTVEIHKKKDHKEISLNFEIKINTKEKIQIAAVIKVKVITCERLQSQYIQFIKHRTPLYINVCLQFKCQQLIKDFQTKQFQDKESLISMEQQTLDERDRSHYQHKKPQQNDGLKKMSKSAQNLKKKIQSSSSSSSGSIKSIKQSSHLFQGCSSLIYLAQKIFPVKCLFEICLIQLINKSNEFNFEGFKLRFKEIKGRDGFKIQQHNLYLCNSCKVITILGNLLQNIDIILQNQQKNSSLQKKLDYFLFQLSQIRQKSKCLFKNWQKYDDIYAEKRISEEQQIKEILMKNQSNISQIQVQKQIQEDKNPDKKLQRQEE